MSVLLDVRPTAYTDAARTLGNEVAVCTQLAWLGLQRALGECSGMAGSDTAGTTWGSGYDAAAAAATTATESVVNASYQLAALLEQCGINYASAEQASVPGGTAALERNRWAGSTTTLDELESAIGFGTPAPFGWGQLSHAIGYLWPNGHQDRLHAAAGAWVRAGDQILSVVGDIDRAVVELMLQRAPEVDDAVAVIDGMRRHLTDLAAAYFSIGGSCTDYAHHVDAAHHAIINEIKDFLETTAYIEGGGLLLSVVTVGLSEVAAQSGELVEVGRAALAIRSIIEALVAATSSARAAVEATKVQALAITDRVAPILARRIEAVQLAGATDRGELIIGRKLQAQMDRAGGGGATSSEGLSLQKVEAVADIGPASETWGDLRTLKVHFEEHKSDFAGLHSQEAYARAAAAFLRRARREHLPTKVDANGNIRCYDPRTNTFGSYRPDGRTRTFYKPARGSGYWDDQDGELVK